MTAVFASSIADGANKEDSELVGSGSFLGHVKTCKNSNRDILSTATATSDKNYTLQMYHALHTLQWNLIFIQFNFVIRGVERNEQKFPAIQ